MSNNEAKIISDQDWEWWCGLPDSLKYVLMMNTPYIGDLLKLDDKGKIEVKNELYDRTGKISEVVAYYVGSEIFGEGLDTIKWKEGVSTEDINQLAYLPSLKCFEARSCGLTEIPANTVFEEIRIGEGNHIQDISYPNELVKLKKLSIRDNSLSEQCWENLGKIPNLEKLKLTGTNIKVDSPAEFVKLKELYIRDNPLSEKSWEYLGKIPHLEVLELFNTNISVTRSAGFLSLESLIIKSNELTEQCWEFLEKIPHLEHLSLCSNNIIEVPRLSLNLRTLGLVIRRENGVIGLENLASLSNLKTLMLTTNCTESLPDLSELTSLKYWRFDKSELTAKSFEGVKLPPNLEELDLSHNKALDDIPDAVCKLTKLVSLHLDGTQITEKALPKLASLTYLEELYLPKETINENDAEVIQLKAKLPHCEIRIR
ncbi:hypothetical protein B0187_01195 [Haemophilus paracuniculus]|uniref:Leucine-rich repeat domain-containing protein n=1 Tax=Haemophilus paracuniculus TaxID=734 RepID=A0A1T0AV09_9PAST|nr:hypothetical protein [Haemophilus paracuniculus]OOS00551.1 hypothetical protein B0187_01195 [Haemophilus paracuniculus]